MKAFRLCATGLRFNQLTDQITLTNSRDNNNKSMPQMNDGTIMPKAVYTTGRFVSKCRNALVMTVSVALGP